MKVRLTLCVLLLMNSFPASLSRLTGQNTSGAIGKYQLTSSTGACDLAVLGMFLWQLCKYCKEEHDISHGIDEFWIYEFAKIWNCDQETSNHRVHEFFKSEHFRDGIPVIPGASLFSCM